MGQELPPDLDPQANRLAKIGAVAGAITDVGIDGVLGNPDIVSGISSVIAESGEAVSPERAAFLEGVAQEVMEQHGVSREEAMKMMLGALSEMLVDTLEKLGQAEASGDAATE